MNIKHGEQGFDNNKYALFLVTLVVSWVLVWVTFDDVKFNVISSSVSVLTVLAQESLKLFTISQNIIKLKVTLK